MKKIISVLMSTIIALTSSALTFGAEGKIVNGRTMVPVRGVFEELGFYVNYDTATATAIIQDNFYTIKIPKDKTYFIVNGKSIKPDTPQTIIDGNMYLPLRSIGDSIGATTSWDNSKKIAHILYNGLDSYVSCNTPTVANSNSNVSDNTPEILHYLSTGKNGTEYYSISKDTEDYFIQFAEKNIKDGNAGISIMGKSLKYPHTAVFSDSDALEISGGAVCKDTSGVAVENYGKEYTITITGYVSSQLPTGLMKETKYYANIGFNMRNNQIIDVDLIYVLISD